MRPLKRALRPVKDSRGVRIPQAPLEHLGLDGKIEILITERRIETRAADDPKDDRPRSAGGYGDRKPLTVYCGIIRFAGCRRSARFTGF
jgi:hypothetical protein